MTDHSIHGTASKELFRILEFTGNKIGEGSTDIVSTNVRDWGQYKHIDKKVKENTKQR